MLDWTEIDAREVAGAPEASVLATSLRLPGSELPRFNLYIHIILLPLRLWERCSDMMDDLRWNLHHRWSKETAIGFSFVVTPESPLEHVLRAHSLLRGSA